jgi:hypothetical protein
LNQNAYKLSQKKAACLQFIAGMKGMEKDFSPSTPGIRDSTEK